MEKIVLTLTWIATSIWITFISFYAWANWLMILRCTPGIESAWTNARILALLCNASTIRRTLLMNHTFGSAIWWCAKHSICTRAHRTTVNDMTFGIWSTSTRQTWIYIDWCVCCCENVTFTIRWCKMISIWTEFWFKWVFFDIFKENFLFYILKGQFFPKEKEYFFANTKVWNEKQIHILTFR